MLVVDMEKFVSPESGKILTVLCPLVLCMDSNWVHSATKQQFSKGFKVERTMFSPSGNH